jgi:Na+/H+-dicarboxylate symporter
VLTTLALVIGLLVANIAEPGVGMHDETSVQENREDLEFTEKAHDSEHGHVCDEHRAEDLRGRVHG